MLPACADFPLVASQEYRESKQPNFLSCIFAGSLVKGAPTPYPLSNTPAGGLLPAPVPKVRIDQPRS